MTRPLATDPARFVIDAMATFRLVKLVREDRIAAPLRDAVEDKWGPPDKSMISYLLDCPWCLSVYFGVGLTLLGNRWPRATVLLTRGLALSAATGVMTEELEARSAD